MADNMIDVHASCVVVVVDVHVVLWSLRENFGTKNFLKLEDVSSLVSVYCNTVALMHRRNKVYVIFHSHNVGTYLQHSVDSICFIFEHYIRVLPFTLI